MTKKCALICMVLVTAALAPAAAGKAPGGPGGSLPVQRTLSGGADTLLPALQLDSGWQLMADAHALERTEGLEFRLHQPQRREQVMTYDQPWEGSGSDFQVLVRDDSLIRMYYTAAQLTNTAGTRMGGHPAVACYAESRDGIHWVKPDLGLFDFNGSRHNNIIWAMPHFDNFTPFKDPNPDCRPGERYKAVGAGKGGLYAFRSPDGIHWSYLADSPIITKGAFDSQNNAFWDPLRRQYWCYFRGFHEGIRDIRVSVSTDFLHWSEPRRISFGEAPEEALYTNQVLPYFRSPSLFVGFPTLYVERKITPPLLAALPDSAHRRRRMAIHPRYGAALTNGLFMCSRDGIRFRRWEEPFIPPGPERSNNWVYGDGYQSLGLLTLPAEDTTAAPEITFYAGEGHWKDSPTLRRYTIRLDGFVSAHAPGKGGELLTRPLVFSGSRLQLNFATSVTGVLKVAITDAAGHTLEGYTWEDCDEIFGDSVDRTVSWKGKADLSALAGRTLRLRILIRGGDLYSFRFH